MRTSRQTTPTLTKVLVEDGDHIRIGQVYARHLAQSLIETKETLSANILNRAFNASYPGGDGVALNSTSHPIVNGTFSNRLTTDANLSQTSLEQMLIQIRQAVDNNQKKIRLVPRQLVVAPGNVFQAEVLLKSVLRAGNANNDINPVKSIGLLDEGAAVISRLTSATAWWVQTDAPEGMKLLMRRKLEKTMKAILKLTLCATKRQSVIKSASPILVRCTVHPASKPKRGLRPLRY